MASGSTPVREVDVGVLGVGLLRLRSTGSVEGVALSFLFFVSTGDVSWISLRSSTIHPGSESQIHPYVGN